jgi:hypothetical protein
MCDLPIIRQHGAELDSEFGVSQLGAGQFGAYPSPMFRAVRPSDVAQDPGFQKDAMAYARSGHRTAALAVFALLTAALFCAGGSLARAHAAKLPGLTPADLANMTYHIPYTASGTATLLNGVYGEPAAPGSAASVVVTLTDFTAYGVLNGVDAAAVVLRTETGGSGVSYDLAVVVRQLLTSAQGTKGDPSPGCGDECAHRVRADRRFSVQRSGQ